MVALDSNIFIYTLERHPEFFESASKKLQAAVLEGAVMSSLVYAECLSKLRGRDFEKSRLALDQLCNRGKIQIVTVDKDVAILTAQLRATKRMGLADAIHVASAIIAGATRMVTNDKDLLRQKITNLSFEGI